MSGKYRYFIFLLVALLLFSCKKEKDTGFTISGELHNVQSDTLWVHDITTIKDSLFYVAMHDNRFAVSLPIDTDAVLEVIDPVTFNSFILFAGKWGRSDVSGDMSDETKITVSGGKDNELYNAFKRDYSSLRDSLAADSVAASLDAASDSLCISFVRDNLLSRVSAFVIERFMMNRPKPDYVAIAELTEELTGFVLDMPSMHRIKPVAEKKSKVSEGYYKPVSTMKLRSGKFIQARDYTGKKYCLLQFWASWSQASRNANKEIDSLLGSVRKIGDKGFDIIGVCLDSDTLALDKAVEEDGISWKQLCDGKSWDGTVADKYAVTDVPGNVLISPDGSIVARDLDAGGLKLMLDSLAKAKK